MNYRTGWSTHQVNNVTGELHFGSCIHGKFRLPQFSLQALKRANPSKKGWAFTCTLLAQLTKQLKTNGAGEGNRSLVSGLSAPWARVGFQPTPKFLKST
jgi:hypothetical protein